MWLYFGAQQFVWISTDSIADNNDATSIHPIYMQLYVVSNIRNTQLNSVNFTYM